ncbi:hypothetical protein GOARA_006_00030 [Gordonia araii NBRC 100433]|uniref:DUF222 domain-containing protein n=1 Tax=Gordonia araii NBRC 100433 TaxID=1073574 RepID=G7GXB9_9ACTN|nr:DUF222 domain-containing protein [Gordonia araii]NNG95968.1 DUF222 domain-containing protein [Gordonia araii NBRC 100433]GAB08244.1 hypothetical protein GOARA_006_00030 [Gordonia araii NBRC 100433]
MEFELPDAPLELLRLADAALAKAASSPLAAATADELLETARSSERLRRRQVGFDAQLLVEINDRGAHEREGFMRVMTWLAQGLRLGHSEAKRRYGQAQKIGRLTGMTGQTMPPALPATAGAVAAGDIGHQHVAVIMGVMRGLPHSLPTDVRETAEADLAGMAATLAPTELKRAGQRLIELLDPDGRLSDEVDRQRNRSLWLGHQDRRTMTEVAGRLTPVVRAKLELLLANWAAPGMNNPDDPAAERLVGSVEDLPDSEAARERLAQARRRDHRSVGQRNHDALETLLDYVIGHGGLGKPKRIPGQLVITASLAEIKARCGNALTSTGSLVPIGDLVDLAAHLDPSLVVFQNHSREILYLGRTKRSATFAQRLALFARDRGCTAPDCDSEFHRSEAHHLPDWAKGGATDIDKLTASDGRHNRAVGERAGQWETIYQRSGPRAGRVAWRLRCRDGELGQPRINQTHHPDDLARDAASVKQLQQHRQQGTNTDPPSAPQTDDQSAVEARLCSRLGYTIL